MTAGELYESLTTRIANSPAPVENLYSAIGIVSDYLATRLFSLGSKLLRKEVVLSYAAGVSKATLPSNLIGTVEAPFFLQNGITGGTNLDPLPADIRAYYAGRTGTPDYFEIVGNSLVLYPTPDQAYTVTFEASLYPDKPATVDEDVPFNGLFDYIFREVVILVMLQGGGAVLQADAFLTNTLDGIDRNRVSRKVSYRYFIT